MRLLKEAISLRQAVERDRSIGESRSLPSNFHQDRLDTVISIPVRKARKLVIIDSSVCLVHEGKVDPGDKLYDGRLLGVMFPACNLEAVDTVLMYSLLYANIGQYAFFVGDVFRSMVLDGTRVA